MAEEKVETLEISENLETKAKTAVKTEEPAPKNFIEPDNEQDDVAAKSKKDKEKEEEEKSKAEKAASQKSPNITKDPSKNNEPEDSLEDMQSKFSGHKPPTEEETKSFWEKWNEANSDIKKIAKNPEGKGIDVTFTNGMKVTDTGSKMSVIGAGGKVPSAEDFDKIVAAASQKGWRAISIGDNCSEEFKKGLYLATAKAGMDCILNSYTPNEDVRIRAQELYAEANKGSEKDSDKAPASSTSGTGEPQKEDKESDVNAPEKSVKPKTNETEISAQPTKSKGGRKKKPKEEKPKNPAAYIEKYSSQMIKDVNHKQEVELAGIDRQQFALWHKEFKDVSATLKANPQAKLNSHLAKVMRNAEKYGYDKTDKIPKDLKISPKDYDKKVMETRVEKKLNNDLRKAAIENVATAFMKSEVDGEFKLNSTTREHIEMGVSDLESKAKYFACTDDIKKDLAKKSKDAQTPEEKALAAKQIKGIDNDNAKIKSGEGSMRNTIIYDGDKPRKPSVASLLTQVDGLKVDTAKNAAEMEKTLSNSNKKEGTTKTVTTKNAVQIAAAKKLKDDRG